MKKIFSWGMAAACVCGAAWAEENGNPVLNTSGCMGGETFTYTADLLTINIDSSPTLGFIHGTGETDSTIKLNFFEDHVLQCSSGFTWTANTVHFNIKADDTTQAAWARVLSSAKNPAAVTLVNAGTAFSLVADAVDAKLLGQDTVGETLTLGGHTATYMGFFTTLDAAKKSITAAGQVALAADNANGTFSLVGRLSRNTAPEPATATLSLLALAGLATRRRRK